MGNFERTQTEVLARRLKEPRRFIQAVVGPRQVGKTTLARGVAEGLGVPVRYASADEPTLRERSWIAEQWEAARLEAKEAGRGGARGGSRGGSLLVLDEVQKVPGWSETVKRLWDEDTRAKRPLKVVVLGSAPLLVQRGLTES